ncbi:MAG: bifunctional 4-hydroxy-3-methylbut-2-enyl diphosphate reductase/30S ribosomal protein S1, partial [Chloroflexota bacterium]
VVGGRNSANTSQLANLCLAMGVPTYHVETSQELRDEWFAGAEVVGVTAGASTPDWIIGEVEECIRDRGGNG